MNELEQMPPFNSTHHHLWAMGFTKEERDRIIETSSQMWPNDPLSLPCVPWWARLWNTARRILRL